MTVFRILIFCFKLAGEAASSLPCCLVLVKVISFWRFHFRDGTRQQFTCTTDYSKSHIDIPHFPYLLDWYTCISTNHQLLILHTLRLTLLFMCIYAIEFCWPQQLALLILEGVRSMFPFIVVVSYVPNLMKVILKFYCYNHS